MDGGRNGHERGRMYIEPAKASSPPRHLAEVRPHPSRVRALTNYLANRIVAQHTPSCKYGGLMRRRRFSLSRSEIVASRNPARYP